MNNTFQCPSCHAQNLKNSRFCCMCGIRFDALREQQEAAMKSGEIPLIQREFSTENGMKTIEVLCRDITDLPGNVDILTLSAYSHSYSPTPSSVIGALYNRKGISVSALSDHPFIDLRESAGCWLSEKIESDLTNGNSSDGQIQRIGCVEMRGFHHWNPSSGSTLTGLHTYFHMLDISATVGVSMKTIAMPILGAGDQNINANLVVFPLVNEAISFLKRNPSGEKVVFVERNYMKARLLADVISKSYQISELETVSKKKVSEKDPYVFISYTNNGDTHSAEIVCEALRRKGIRYWFAPTELNSGSYAGKIVEAINRCTHFICLISENSMNSQHVLNEIDLAFQHLSDGMLILPYRLDGQGHELKPEFKYYLSRMQWHYGTPPPEEQRAREFIDQIFGA